MLNGIRISKIINLFTTSKMIKLTQFLTKFFKVVFFTYQLGISNTDRFLVSI